MSDQKFNYIPTCVFIRNIHGDNASRDLVTHYKRIGQVADRYGNNARVIRSEFISNAIVLSIRRKNINALGYFLKKNLFYPESGFKVLVKFVFSISSYLFGRKRLG